MSAEYGRLIEHVLGIPGEDWRIERWPDEYEGWQASLVTPCDEAGCYCCDPRNLTRADADLLLALFPAASA